MHVADGSAQHAPSWSEPTPAGRAAAAALAGLAAASWLGRRVGQRAVKIRGVYIRDVVGVRIAGAFAGCRAGGGARQQRREAQTKKDGLSHRGCPEVASQPPPRSSDHPQRKLRPARTNTHELFAPLRSLGASGVVRRPPPMRRTLLFLTTAVGAPARRVRRRRRDRRRGAPAPRPHRLRPRPEPSVLVRPAAARHRSGGAADGLLHPQVRRPARGAGDGLRPVGRAVRRVAVAPDPWRRARERARSRCSRMTTTTARRTA